MGIAITLENYLESQHAAFNLVSHPRRIQSSEIAEAAHISGERLAKAVLLTADHGHLMVVLPSTHKVDLAKISHEIGERLGLSSEDEIGEVFKDCEIGAIPACGEAYGLRVLMDESLHDLKEVYFEAGDHKRLVHMTGGEFERLLPHAEFGSYSHHV